MVFQLIRRKKKSKPCSKKAAALGKQYSHARAPVDELCMNESNRNRKAVVKDVSVRDPGRRRFIQGGLSAAAGALAIQSTSVGSASAADFGSESRASTGSVPRKPFGRTGIQVSLFGIGGHQFGTLASQGKGHRPVD